MNPVAYLPVPQPWVSRRLLRRNRPAQTAPPGPVSYLSERPPTCLTFQVRTQESPLTSTLPPRAPLPPLSSRRVTLLDAWQSPHLVSSYLPPGSSLSKRPFHLYGSEQFGAAGLKFTPFPQPAQPVGAEPSLSPGGHHGLLAGHRTFTGFPGRCTPKRPCSLGFGALCVSLWDWHLVTHLITHLRCANTHRLPACTRASGPEQGWSPVPRAGVTHTSHLAGSC